MAHNMPLMSPDVIDLTRSSFAEVVVGSGSTKTLLTYFAVMYARRASYEDCAPGFGNEGFGIRSQMELLTILGRRRSRLMSVGVKDVVSRVNDRIFEICEPRLRCTPEHSSG